MSGIVGIFVITALCIFGFAFGAALALAAGNNGNPVPAVIGIVIYIVSFIGICFLEDPFTDENMYQKMPQNVKNAIIPVKIQQNVYAKDGTTVKRNREIPAYRKVSSSDSIVRHIFLPSIEEIGNTIDLNDEDIVLDFLHEAEDSLRHKDIWTRDSLLFGEESWNTNTAVMTIMQHFCSAFFDDVQMIHGVRPAFVVDISKLNKDVL